METTVLTCDCCNLEFKVGLAEWFNALGGRATARGIVDCSFEEAQGYGWELRDYGHCCPRCAIEELEGEALGDTGIGLDALEDSLQLKKMLE